MSTLYRGNLLLGEATSKKLTDEDKTNIYKERQTQFYTDCDFMKGKIGKMVCCFNHFHPDYEKYSRLLEAAPLLFEVCDTLRNTPILSINLSAFKARLEVALKIASEGAPQFVYSKYQNEK